MIAMVIAMTCSAIIAVGAMNCMKIVSVSDEQVHGNYSD